MKLTARDLCRAGIVEKVIPEPEHYTVLTLGEVTAPLADAMERFLETYSAMETGERTQRRYERFRRM